MTARSPRLRSGARIQTPVRLASQSCCVGSIATVWQGHNILPPWWLRAPGYPLADSLHDPWHPLGRRMGQWLTFLQVWIWGHVSHSREASKSGARLPLIQLRPPHPVLRFIKPRVLPKRCGPHGPMWKDEAITRTVAHKCPVSDQHQDAQSPVKCLGLAKPREGWGPSMLSCKGNCGFFLSFFFFPFFFFSLWERETCVSIESLWRCITESHRKCSM